MVGHELIIPAGFDTLEHNIVSPLDLSITLRVGNIIEAYLDSLSDAVVLEVTGCELGAVVCEHAMRQSIST